MIQSFKKIGKALFLQGINSSHSGNMSVRDNEYIYITRSGSTLFDLHPEDIVKVPLNSNYQSNASMELIVHRSIYINTKAKAIVHAHPPYLITLSYILNNEFIPIDSEGMFLTKKAPIINFKETIASKEVAQNLPKYFQNKEKIVILKTHGSFAIGENLEEAFAYTSSLEKSAQIFYLLKIISPQQASKQLMQSLNKLKRKEKTNE